MLGHGRYGATLLEEQVRLLSLVDIFIEVLKMEKTLLRHLQVEVEKQCQFVIIALQDMDEAAASGDGELFWYSVQNALVAIGRISRLLWPPDPLFPNRGGRVEGEPGGR